MAAFFGSVTGAVSRCGTPSYCPISTRFGSIRIIRTWSGVERIRIEVTRALMHEDLPAPVAPAIRRCGMVARFSMTDRPLMSRPIPASNGWRALDASGDVRMSPSATTSRSSLGTSMPMACWPGMGARILTSAAARA